jgi:uncharacterized RDD family membrane protein YckC
MSDEGYGIFCAKCRAVLPWNATVCTTCGAELAASTTPPAFRQPSVPDEEALTAAGVSPEVREILFGRPSAITPASYAGFWIRGVALTIDTVLIVGLGLLLSEYVAPAAAIVELVAAGFLYRPLMESSRTQGTIGKAFCGLVVTDTSGRRISIARAYARTLAHSLTDAFSFTYLLVLFTRRKQALHDLIAGTLVLKKGLY